MVVLVRDGDGERIATKKTLAIALVACTCGKRVRMLPSDVLPLKHYGLAIVAELCQAHVVEDQSLRDGVLKKFIGQTPAHATLHAWTEGLGAFALGRQGSTHAGAAPFSAILAETTKRWPLIATEAATTPPINPDRYRSEERRERNRSRVDIGNGHETGPWHTRSHGSSLLVRAKLARGDRSRSPRREAVVSWSRPC